MRSYDTMLAFGLLASALLCWRLKAFSGRGKGVDLHLGYELFLGAALLFLAAATQALDDAGWHPKTYDEQCATGVLIGSGIGGLSGIHDTSLLLKEKGPRRISPFFIPGRLINLVSGYVSIQHGLKGPNHAVVTACSTGAHAIGDAARLIMLGDADRKSTRLNSSH